MKITKEVKTALLAIVAIALLIFGYSFLKGNNLLQDNRTFYATYNEVEGLAKSSTVTINGLKVGSITDISFLNKKGRVLVTMNIEDDFEFTKKSVARIYGGSLIGGKSMAIIPHYEGELANSGDTLVGDIEEGLLELVNDRLTPLQQKVESAIVSADSLLYAINDILNEKTREDLKQTFANLNQTVASFNGVANKANNILGNNEEKLNRTFTNLDEMSGNFNKFSDSIAQIDLNKMVGDFEGVIADFKKISDDLNNGKGTAGKLLKDDKVYNNMDRATKQLEQLLQDIKLNPKRYVHFSVFGKNGDKYKKPKDSLK
ncbi:phospholipid/cholesterol/gamma-HCH transport system substrate-binding protein [Mesonia algae]|uniref:Phospholipid/cholesterol/gamma-HCH transport system substrate-binding protein n=1 Tax=Mesonia algae TaxID=213248 RepID=A0A2W7I8R4_9FLAO|nr:MlaD family protein [Mesonia algae]PZW42528.1 phospholipid/cholesterol/gamma-HCH transport system substrate-binding protein [Mesonia algae]